MLLGSREIEVFASFSSRFDQQWKYRRIRLDEISRLRITEKGQKTLDQIERNLSHGRIKKVQLFSGVRDVRTFIAMELKIFIICLKIYSL